MTKPKTYLYLGETVKDLGLTQGKIYDSFQTTDSLIEVKTDHGNKAFCHVGYFEPFKRKIVVCVDNRDPLVALTRNKEYEVIQQHELYLKVVDDIGREQFYELDRFNTKVQMTVDEYQDLALRTASEEYLLIPFNSAML